jgi:hypothetical protein
MRLSLRRACIAIMLVSLACVLFSGIALRSIFEGSLEAADNFAPPPAFAAYGGQALAGLCVSTLALVASLIGLGYANRRLAREWSG